MEIEEQRSRDPNSLSDITRLLYASVSEWDEEYILATLEYGGCGGRRTPVTILDSHFKVVIASTSPYTLVPGLHARGTRLGLDPEPWMKEFQVLGNE